MFKDNTLSTQIHRVSKTIIKDSNDFWNNSMKNGNLSHKFPNKIVQFIWLSFIGSCKKGPISFKKYTDINISVEPIQSTDELN